MGNEIGTALLSLLFQCSSHVQLVTAKGLRYETCSKALVLAQAVKAVLQACSQSFTPVPDTTSA